MKSRFNKINRINLSSWKEYDDLLIDSLWIFNKRDNNGVHENKYWGNFIPQIPNQLIRRFTKKGDWVLDPFLGGGTTMIEAQRLDRNCLGIELQKKIAKNVSKIIKSIKNNKTKQRIITGDCTTISLSANSVKNKFQLLILHPPYWDIIKFSKQKNDLSQTKTLSEFLLKFSLAIQNLKPFLSKNAYVAIVIGDAYKNSQWVPLGFHCMQTAIQNGLMLKSIIVKNQEETRGKVNQKNLWRYRALASDYYLFKHEYVFILKNTSIT